MASIDQPVTDADEHGARLQESEIEFLVSRIKYLNSIWEFGTSDNSGGIKGKLMNSSDKLLRLKKLVWFLKGFRHECASAISAIEDRIEDILDPVA